MQAQLTITMIDGRLNGAAEISLALPYDGERFLNAFQGLATSQLYELAFAALEDLQKKQAQEVKPEEVKPEEVKPEEVKPEEVKPEEVKPPELAPIPGAVPVINPAPPQAIGPDNDGNNSGA